MMDQGQFTDFVRANVNEGQRQFADIVRTLLYRRAPQLFRQLDFYNDEIFLEPLLFAYFNSKEPPVKLDQILVGYIGDEPRPAITSVFADTHGVVYLPNIGYLVTDTANEELILVWDRGSSTYRLEHENSSVSYDFEDIIRGVAPSVEVCRYSHPLFTELYTGMEGDVVNVEVKESVQRHIHHLNTAFRVLGQQYPHYYEAILDVTRKVVIFNGKGVNSFATLSAHGTAFLNADETDDEVFFIEDIVHQCGHVIFSALTFEKQEYFRVDPNTPLRLFTKDERERRTVYITLHGLFTEAAMAESLNLCYENNVFHGRQEHELVGRLAFILKRFSHDLRNLAHRDLFTEKGLSLYNDFKDVFLDIFQKRQDFVGMFDTSNQPYTFSYAKFVELNPLNGRLEDSV